MTEDKLEDPLLPWQAAILQKMQSLANSLHGSATSPETTADRPTGPLQPSADEEPSLAPGSTFAGYTIVQLLGKGGMGEVYLATDPVLHRSIAIKVMKAEIARDARARERFLREARAVAALTDDHIVTIHAVGEVDGQLYLVMPLLRGQSLQDRLKQTSRLDAIAALRIARETAQGLTTAHRAGLVHRDIKPANLWLEDASDRVKILDFGLVRSQQTDQLTHSGVFCGTPGYVAPEQVDGATPTPAADLFSLGCVLYRMLTGQSPFEAPTLTAMLLAVARCEPISPAQHDPTLPSDVVDLVLRLLRRDPTARPASADALITEIRTLERNFSTAVTLPEKRAEPKPPALVERVEKPTRETNTRRIDRRSILVAGVLVALAALVVISVLWWPRPPMQTQPEPLGPLKGDVDLFILKVDDAKKGSTKGLRLSMPGVLPLEEGDAMRVEITMTRPTYLYVIWLDASGVATPMYPWTERNWGNRLNEEQRTVLTFPPVDEKAGELEGGPSGVETILVLARDTPLPVGADAELDAVFKQSWKPTTWKGSANFAAWLENGETTTDARRGPISDEKTKPLVDPVMQTQRLLKRDLQPWFTYSRAVCYSFKGD